MKNSMTLALFFFSVFTSTAAIADVGQPKPEFGLRPSTNHVQCTHFKGASSERLDQFTVVLPSAGTGNFLMREEFSFSTQLKTSGPNGIEEVPLTGVFVVNIREASNFGIIDIAGSFRMFNPFLSQTDILNELESAIYTEPAFLTNRLRDPSKTLFKLDFKRGVDEVGGWFHCAPVNTGFGAELDPTFGRIIQGVAVQD